MDFGKKVLEKLGWKEGVGLGRNSDGIVNPLKASMKFDKAGLGSNLAEDEFNNHWWQRVFDDAASNLKVINTVEGKEGKVMVGLKSSDDVLEISTKSYSVKKMEKIKKERQQKQSKESVVNYGNFIPASKEVKMDQNADKNKDSKHTQKEGSEDISVPTIKVLSDEELFAACGGRTAHKGARHGLYLSGKLSRLEQQEAILLEQMQRRISKQNGSGSMEKKEQKQQIVMDIGERKRKDEKEKTCSENNLNNYNGEEAAARRNSSANEKQKLKEHKKKKKKRKDSSLERDGAMELCQEEETNTSQKRKKKKRCKSDEEEESEITDNLRKLKKKKRKRSKSK